MSKLTNSFVYTLPFPDKGQVFYRDSSLPGFGLRVTPTRRTYIVEYFWRIVWQGRVSLVKKAKESMVALIALERVQVLYRTVLMQPLKMTMSATFIQFS